MRRPGLFPGWVRYAERVLGHPITPHLCTAKSPQQVMGSLVKDYFARRQVSRPLSPGSAGLGTGLPAGLAAVGTEASEGGTGAGLEPMLGGKWGRNWSVGDGTQPRAAGLQEGSRAGWQVGVLFSTALGTACCPHRTCPQTRFSTSSWPRAMTGNWRPFEKMFPQL